MIYSIDTSAILDGWRRYYPPDVFPNIWTQIDNLIEKKILLATEEVLVELEKQDDEVYEWALQRKDMFVPIDEQIQSAVSIILAKYQKLIDQRTNRSGADPFVIGLAMIKEGAVITGERPTHSEKRPHIPDVCDGMGVRWLNLLQLFREQKWIFQ